MKKLWTVSSTWGHIYQTQNWVKDGNKTEVDMLNVNCVRQEGIERRLLFETV